MKYLLIALTLGLSFMTYAQHTFRVMSYNVENFFDVKDDPQKEDNDFLPTGNHFWNKKRYYHKLQQISKVITAAGEWNTPALIGLCEIENDSVLYDLTHRTPLCMQDYRYILTEHSDVRGIRVGFLYQREQFKYLNHQSIAIRFSRKKHKSTREILHVTGEIISHDTLDVLVVHFPSKYGGEKESEQDRLDAATTLRSICDSLSEKRVSPKILIMGDFNATLSEPCLTKGLMTTLPSEANQAETRLVSLQTKAAPKGINGTHKYQGEWSQIDHIIVNHAFFEPESRIQVQPESVRIFAPKFLTTEDKTWRGIRPFRTYYGYRYERGFSDHFPLIADFYILLPSQIEKSHEQ